MFKKTFLDSLTKVLGALIIFTYVIFALSGLVIVYLMVKGGESEPVARLIFIVGYEIIGFMFFGIIYLITGFLQKINQVVHQSINDLTEKAE